MALPSNKPSSSSSPILSRMNPVSVSRSSETGNPVRRSFVGNPFVKPSMVANLRGLNPKTPASSPLDYHRHNSTDSRDFEEKENGKDHNPKTPRARSPTIPNRAKNFMSPTISASSKIAMSPKKTILAEKNEPVRTSLSLSDSKSSPINSANPHEAIQPSKLKQKPTESNDDFSSAVASSDFMDQPPAFQASKLSKATNFDDQGTKHSGSLSNTTFETAEPANIADRFKISPIPLYLSSKSSPVSEPLDSDPSMLPPYDSKTNYLSPRPRFLLYKPNPRIERYLHKEEYGDNKLEGRILSESFDNTEVTEETQSESFHNSDEVSSDEFVEEVENQNRSEPSGLVGKDNVDKNSEAKGTGKPFNLYKLTALILLLCIGCSSVLYNNYPSEIHQFAKSSYPEMAKSFWVLSENVVAYANGLVLHFGEEGRLIHPVQYFNLTALREGIPVDGYFVFDQSPERIDGFLTEPTREFPLESEEEEEEELVQKHVELEEEAEQKYSEIMEDPEPSLEEEEHQESELHGLQELAREISAPESEEVDNNLEITDEKLPVESVRVEEGEEEESFELHEGLDELSGENSAVEMNHNSEVKDEKLPLKPVQVEELAEESSEIDVEINDDEPESSESSAMAALSNVNPLSSVILLLLPLMAATVYFYPRRVKSISSDDKESKAKDLSFSKDDNLIKHRPLSWDFQTEGDIVEQSCPSEMSSSYGKKGARGGGSNKAPSQEMKLKNYRRESLSSSLDYSISTDSPSLGSFTVYKKFSTKHSNCEEEVVTPVRRSSRIKTKLNVSDD